MSSRRHILPLVVCTCMLAPRFVAWAQEGRFLTDAEAPAAVFPDADRFESHTVPDTPTLREAIRGRMAPVTPSMWEDAYVVVSAFRGMEALGQAVIVEEIGKHRPITFVVGLRSDGTVQDVAVVAYREAYGGEIRSRRFLRQYVGRRPTDDLRPYHGIQNVAGATLSVEAASRAVRKAQAIAAALKDGSR